MLTSFRAPTICAAILAIVPMFGQDAPPLLPPPELDRLVDRIALYPDPLLAQILAAATYFDQIPDAARWSDEHHYLTGQALADAIQGDRLPWDPSVQALLPFPSVLDMMARDGDWTRRVGDAFMSQQQDVMDAVQRDRRKARDFGYLRSNAQIVVGGGPYITVMPVNPGFIVVPYYDPAVVYFAPRPGFVVAGAIGFGFGVTIGGYYRPWGWGYNRFDWGSHVVIVNNAPWRRTWAVRSNYVHPYTVTRYPAGGHYEERHELHERSAGERGAWSHNQPMREEHRGRH